MTEYEFVLPDGSKRYEFCSCAADVYVFMKMHGATTAAPVQKEDDTP